MIEGYEIQTLHNEKVLVFHFNYTYEFGNLKRKEKGTILNTIHQFIKEHKIDYHGSKIALAVCGVIVCTLFLNQPSTNYQTFDDALENQVVALKLDNQFIKLNNEIPVINTFVKKEEAKVIKVKSNNVKNQVSSSKSVSKKRASVKKGTNTASTVKNKRKTSTVNNKKQSSTPNVSEVKVKVYRSNGKVVTLSLEDYVIGVVGAEMPASFHLEALKAQAVVARTYAMNAISNGKKLTDTVSTQVYKDNSQLKSMWGNSYSTYYQKVKSAVQSTKGVVLTYQGNYIYAVYHSTSNGKTEDAKNVWDKSEPYLKSVSSTWDKNVSSYEKKITKEFTVLNKTLGLSVDKNTAISVVRNASGRVSTITIGNKQYTGVQFRNLLGLRSADFDIIKDRGFEITTRGYGHGVGMSQYGANEMAKNGYQYKQILNHYYTGIAYKTIT